MSKLMEHQATVVAVCTEEKRVDVEIAVSSACGSCKAKEVCGMVDNTVRRVSTHNEHPEFFAVGDNVTVYIEEIMGIKAITYTYLIPLGAMLVTLLATNRLGDLVSGVSTLAVCALYYLVLFFFRKRIEKVIVIRIKNQYF
ncbi:MAG: SoxR reducing system RseC family protein [Tidjanibacter sp.]|nr:SoxR reducing system RseC family protein [Tidjanibacter sp.]